MYGKDKLIGDHFTKWEKMLVNYWVAWTTHGSFLFGCNIDIEDGPMKELMPMLEKEISILRLPYVISQSALRDQLCVKYCVLVQLPEKLGGPSGVPPAPQAIFENLFSNHGIFYS